MKRLVRSLICLLIFSSLISLFNVHAFAAKSVSIDCQPEPKSSTYLKFKADKDGTASIKFTMGKGTLVYRKDEKDNLGNLGQDLDDRATVLGAYEIKINGEHITDIYSVKSKTISFDVQKNKEYEIQIYFWNPETTATSYIDHNIIKPAATVTDKSGAYWAKLPSITASNPKRGNLTLKENDK